MDNSTKHAGRPTKVSRELAIRIANYIRSGMPESDAAEEAGIDRSTFFNFMAWGAAGKAPEYAEFWRIIAEAKRA